MRVISKSNRGFTLIEIIVVIAIIVVLAVVVFLSASQYIAAGEKASSNVSSLEKSFSEAKGDINQSYVDLGY
ncbi:MAG: prepilin-type N-terminal cleavage/methylation domain-containing protein [Clostridiales bacterium]|nr:prepilin-type N-terminal cleavage/methylation domain-containing protein [Clostridiales bacterium]